MAKATAKKTATKKASPKKATTKKAGAKKAAPTKATAKKGGAKKNKLGVKNSLVNNINAKKEKGTSKSPKKSTVTKKAYKNMEDDWGKDKK
ncbi:MAG TPA: hypothetical protein VM010_07230 [Chitinophagaceae bacterium]|nr:hypothetical protein [Chitinophagaceae bacterium]